MSEGVEEFRYFTENATLYPDHRQLFRDVLAHIATLTAETERLRAENDTFSQQNRAWIRENTRLEARVAALEAENERLRDEVRTAPQWVRTILKERVAALEVALRAYVHGQYARGQELARAVLARPTPTPEEEQG